MRRILCALTLAAYPIGGVLADAQTSATEIAVHGSHNAKVTLVYEHELPNVPGKSVKGVLVEYGPGGSSVAHTHPASAFIYATVLEGAIVSKVNEGPETVYRAGDLDDAASRRRERHIGNDGSNVVRRDGLEQAGRKPDHVSIRT